MNNNPVDILNVILADWASPKVRRLIHALLALAAIVVTIWLASDGDWRQSILSLVAALYTGANAANTPDAEDEGIPSLTFTDGPDEPAKDEDGSR